MESYGERAVQRLERLYDCLPGLMQLGFVDRFLDFGRCSRFRPNRILNQYGLNTIFPPGLIILLSSRVVADSPVIV